MREWNAERVAAAAGAQLLSAPTPEQPGPSRAVIDSRAAGPGDLFVGLPGASHDGGAFAAQALENGGWGVLVATHHAEAIERGAGAVLAHPDPLAGLQSLAREWRRGMGASVIGVTGSTGKTSTKDILAALLATQVPTVASPANLNTEIGLPLAVLEAPAGTRALVLEMAMRGAGQIAELTAIAQPDVGVIVNVGPVHLELLGSIEAIAAAKAELIAGLRPGANAVLPAGEPLLDPHRRSDLTTITFGEGGDVHLLGDHHGELEIATPDGPLRLRPSFAQPHHLRNLLAAVGAAGAIGVRAQGELEVAFSALRGERIALPGSITLINDCYNANPMSMVAALEDLSRSAPARSVAVLGDMLELGPRAGEFHREVGRRAGDVGVQVLVAVGPLAAAMTDEFPGEAHLVPDAAAAAHELSRLLQPGDTVLVKGSRGVGLERVAEDLLAGARAA